MKDTVWTILAAVSIAAVIWSLTVLGTYLEEIPRTFESVPQNRPEWPNPAGYGLLPEVKKNDAIFY